MIFLRILNISHKFIFILECIPIGKRKREQKMGTMEKKNKTVKDHEEMESDKVS